MLSMNVKPATISIKPKVITFINHTPPNGKDIDVIADIGPMREKRIQGKNTQISKGRLI